MSRLKGILFDLGDTLLNFGRVDISAQFEAGGRMAYDYLKSLGLPLPTFPRFHRRQFWAIQWSVLKSRLTRREFSALEVLANLSRRMGHALTDEQTRELAWKWYEPLSRQATVEAGTRELLLRLAGQGLKIGLVSNTFVPSSVLDRHLHMVNLLDVLPVRIYSCDVRYRKPHPGIFRIALDRTGLQAGETLFVGDSPHADIVGSNRAGLISVLKDPEGKHPSAKARHRIHRVAELEQIVAGYIA